MIKPSQCSVRKSPNGWEYRIRMGCAVRITEVFIGPNREMSRIMTYTLDERNDLMPISIFYDEADAFYVDALKRSREQTKTQPQDQGGRGFLLTSIRGE